MQNVRGWNLPSFNWAELQDRFWRWAQVWQVQQSIYRCCQDAIGEATQSQESDLACEELWMKVVNCDFSRVLLPCDDLTRPGDICFYHGNVVVTLHSLHGCRLNVVNIGAFIHKHLRLAISQMQARFQNCSGECGECKVNKSLLSEEMDFKIESRCFVQYEQP